MGEFLQKIWRAIREWCRALFGGRSRRSVVERKILPLSDTDREFLFMQLLDGVAHGWHEGRIRKFFEKLDERGREKEWVEWLDRFGNRLQSSAATNQQLALRMIRLGELARTFPGIERIGETSFRIGYQLYTRETENSIWEFTGPDADNGGSPSGNEEYSQVETLSLDELFSRLQNDPLLAGQVATGLGLEGADANEIIARLLEQVPNEAREGPATVEEGFRLGLQQVDRGDWEGALTCWDSVVALDPHLAPGWHNRGSTLALLNRHGEALESFDRALALTPDDEELWNARGNALHALQRWEEALVCWEKALQLRENFYQVWYNRGSTLENLDRPEEAIECYRRSLEIAPDFDLARSRLETLLGQREPS